MAEESSGKGLKNRFTRILRVMVLSGLSFTVNEVPVRAAALSFTTVLAFIPLTIILSYLAGWLGYFDLLPRLIPYILKTIHLNIPLEPVLKGLQRAEGVGFHQVGLLGSVGLLIGFYLSMSNVEEAMNHVWNAREDRGWLGRLRRYTPFLFVMALLLVMSAFMLFRLRKVLERWGWNHEFAFVLPGGSFLFGPIGLLAFLWILIFLMIRLLPNTRVHLRPAVYGATAAIALLYVFSRVLFIFPMLLLSKNQVFYGSLVIFPVALLLIYAFWITVLFGAAVAFVHDKLQHEMGSKLFTHESRGMRDDWREAIREIQVLYLLDKPRDKESHRSLKNLR